MIVDDSKVSRMMIKSIIKDTQSNWQVLEAGNGEEAIEKSEGSTIDYFSIDLNMPGMDGIELIKSLKTNFATAKFVLLTANIQESVHQKAEALEALMINKPITNEQIGIMTRYFVGEQ